MFGFFKKKNSANNVENNVVSRAADDTALQSYRKQAQDEISYLIEFMAFYTAINLCGIYLFICLWQCDLFFL